MPHALLQLVVVIVIAGILLWGLTQVPMDPTLARLARVIIIVAVAIYAVIVLAKFLGVAVG